MGYIIVEIPSCQQHEGYPGALRKYKIKDTCSCGGKRAVKAWRGFSYDGSRRLLVDCWENSCGHVDLYSMVRKEGELVSYDTPSITETIKSNQHEEL